MNNVFDPQDIILKLEAQAHRIENLEHILMDSKEVLNLEEASQFMGMSRSSLYKLTHSQSIPYYKPNGKLIFFEKSELLAWMRQNRIKSSAEINHAASVHLSNLSSGYVR